ncbi:hypothetical protein RJ639_021818 [Escallonia herrerae]|uniref:UDP-glycosyltransferase n=1 Tax=Escallonia herrerae TaxID=1293975 RepID=A0AA88V3G2_9ASTE|nr:hypothetical protein RJ639_021818 [Escallonia herrerae]
MESQIPSRRPRLVIVPFPLQGHISPMLELGTVLLSKGFSITIAHTVLNAPNPSNHPDFFFLPISGYLSGHDTTAANLKALGKAINTNCEAPFFKSLARMMEENKSLDQVVCIIYDVLMYFAEAVAKSMKLPSIIFRNVSALAVLALDTIPWLRAEGYLPCQVSMLQDPVPSLHPVRFKDLPIYNMGSLDDLVKLAIDSRPIRSSSAIIWNTIDHLGHSSLEQLHQLYNVPFFSIGPLHKMAQATSTSLLIEDTDCIEWLDKQAPLSVLYISLGSLATVDKKGLAEMAWGLASSGQPFLWVVRSGSVRDSESPELLPEDFKEKIGERGQIVKWAPQKEVLAHGAVGGFWSHCGWNSILESICEGVPLICMPYFGDQNVNARYLCHVWKIGLELEHELERVQIEKVVKRLMTEKEGAEMRRRTDDLFDPDTSSENLSAPVHDINRTSKEPFRECLTQIRKQQEPHDDIACVIYDPNMYFSEAVASHLKLPSLMFYTASAASLVAYYSISKLLAEGYIPFRAALPSSLLPSRPFAQIGSSGPATSISLLLEDSNCIKWLDKQAPSSVIYVSLGSLATVAEKELTEMAWGLANSSIPFLWVIRPGSVRNSEWIELLPDSFEGKTGERGRIVKWAPQKEVLAHDALGGFWSHCSWDSMVESVCEGVPMICMPCFADQGLNARYLYMWKVGLGTGA